MRKSLIIPAIAIIAAAGVAAGAATAAAGKGPDGSPPGGRGDRWEQLDVNGDGVLSDDELKAGGHRGHGGKHKRR